MGHNTVKGPDWCTLNSPERMPEGMIVQEVSTIGDDEYVIHDGKALQFKKVKDFYVKNRHFLSVVEADYVH